MDKFKQTINNHSVSTYLFIVLFSLYLLDLAILRASNPYYLFPLLLITIYKIVIGATLDKLSFAIISAGLVATPVMIMTYRSHPASILITLNVILFVTSILLNGSNAKKTTV